MREPPPARGEGTPNAKDRVWKPEPDPAKAGPGPARKPSGPRKLALFVQRPRPPGVRMTLCSTTAYRVLWLLPIGFVWRARPRIGARAAPGGVRLGTPLTIGFVSTETSCASCRVGLAPPNSSAAGQIGFVFTGTSSVCLVHERCHGHQSTSTDALPNWLCFAHSVLFSASLLMPCWPTNGVSVLYCAGTTSRCSNVKNQKNRDK